jgi:hypothetical protein
MYLRAFGLLSSRSDKSGSWADRFTQPRFIAGKQSDLERNPATPAAIAPRPRFAAPRQTVAERGLASSRQGRSTLHGVVFDFFCYSRVRDGT